MAVSTWKSIQKFDEITLKRGQPIQLMKKGGGAKLFKTAKEYKAYLSSVHLFARKYAQPINSG
jgi:hypothetical protein